MKKRLCTGCNQEKVLDSKHFTKDKNDSSGFTYRCKICRAKAHKDWALKNPDKVKTINDKNKEKRKKYYNTPENKLKYRKKYIERKFGIKYEVYEQMYSKQNGLCAICGEPETNKRQEYLSLDHCHKKGHIRGLLCNSCNRGLGYFRDNQQYLENAKNYLNESNNVH